MRLFAAARFLAAVLILTLVCGLSGCSGYTPEARSSGASSFGEWNLPKKESANQASRPVLANASPLTLSQLIRKYPNAIKTSGPRVKQIALTFDDVPDPRFTPKILDILKKYNVKATFFLVGSRSAKHPALVRRIVREGHSIGNHSYSHPQFRKLNLQGFRKQIKRSEDTIAGIVGIRPRLIRPPYGDITEQQLRWAAANGYTLVNWNVDSEDWKGISAEQIKANVLPHAGRGAIILQHGGGGKGSDLRGTIQALPDIINTLRQRGYTFVTVPQMLHLSQSR
ncbi:polysaccharide deacetylase family protein [Paenibacillus sp. HN-1]|uniref:polysaccharide deacetylase family protein n=1 Tax=Paenibacillus TaxID=44249 RepID=UPI001CA82038|nr:MULTISPECIES: polysaccharide deacetylase family protein [Paenibacillus]MBY9082091.1 polysaccharide deacetylase family protein [Paenibacillus sp. CGMCC 1.18879]MBY9085751.1 polysaccharide deacetylase family protein [Paenibacillus sinensis]